MILGLKKIFLTTFAKQLGRGRGFYYFSIWEIIKEERTCPPWLGGHVDTALHRTPSPFGKVKLFIENDGPSFLPFRPFLFYPILTCKVIYCSSKQGTVSPFRLKLNLTVVLLAPQNRSTFLNVLIKIALFWGKIKTRLFLCFIFF
jgi:hypothetical protein